jgi:hypothetical protein
MLDGKISQDESCLKGATPMKFRAHDTFFIRKGWLNKGMKHVKENGGVFIRCVGNPMDVLGIGANMVKALRYWLPATGLTEEALKGKRLQTLTPFGEAIFEHDPYLEEIGTLLFIHYKLASNRREATAWYYFFNEFRLMEFNRDDFVLHLTQYIKMTNEATEKDVVSLRSLEDDYACIVNTYVSRKKLNPDKVQPENNIDCPLGEIGLVDILDKQQKTFRKSTPAKESIPPLVTLAIILDQANGAREIKISSILHDPCNVGRIFNLDIITLTGILVKLDNLGFIKVVRTAGLDVVQVTTDMDFLACLKAYYITLQAQ